MENGVNSLKNSRNGKKAGRKTGRKILSAAGAILTVFLVTLSALLALRPGR